MGAFYRRRAEAKRWRGAAQHSRQYGGIGVWVWGQDQDVACAQARIFRQDRHELIAEGFGLA